MEESGEQHPMKRLGGRRSSGTRLLYSTMCSHRPLTAWRFSEGGLATVGVVFVIPTYTGLQP